LQIGLIEHRLRLGERGLGRVELHFEPHRVDAIEHVARLHVGALLKRALQHDSRHARSHFCYARRRDAAGKLADVRPRRGLQRDHAHLRRRNRLLGMRLVTRGNTDDRTSQHRPCCNGTRNSHPVPSPLRQAQ
jgi:hypothetical protein